MFTKFFTKREQPKTITKNWRVGMWVMFEGQVAILVSLDSPAKIHMVDVNTGETVEQKTVGFDSLRQAVWEEIPQCRRNISKEQAKELGYGS